MFKEPKTVHLDGSTFEILEGKFIISGKMYTIRNHTEENSKRSVTIEL